MSDENITNQPSANENNSGGIFDILSKIMTNVGTNTESAPTEKPSGEPNILSALLSNPELLSKLPELISIISPLMGSISSQNTQNNILGNIGNIGAKSTPSGAKPHNNEQQNRSALLCALKPYLKKERQDAIDYMIKLSRLGDILKTL